MAFETWLAFMLAAAIVIALPGPTNLLVMAYTIDRGLRAGLTTVLGVLPGIAVAMFLSLLGLGALLETSSLLFSIVKWAGAAYLVFLGIQQWRQAGRPAGPAPQSKTGSMLLQCFVVTLLNPKGIIFFVAFFPQFIDPKTAVASQTLILGGSFLLLVLPINSAYALLAGGVRQVFAQSGFRRIAGRIGGGILVGAGVMTLALRRD